MKIDIKNGDLVVEDWDVELYADSLNAMAKGLSYELAVAGMLYSDGLSLTPDEAHLEIIDEGDSCGVYTNLETQGYCLLMVMAGINQMECENFEDLINKCENIWDIHHGEGK